jgi:AcrR family transcriptional regulator
MNPMGTIVQPLQKRAFKTRQRILDATLVLLENAGIEKISTNLIASQAEVNIASLYKYFPNKHAILHELAQSFGQKQAGLICCYLAVASPNSSIKTICDGLVDSVIEGTRGGKALGQLQRSLIASPDLLEGKALEMAMLCLGETFSALQDLALSRDASYDQAVISELKQILSAYYESRAAHAR